MRRMLRPFVILFSAILLMASCLGDDTYGDVTYYSDTAITSFSLGTLNRTMWTTSSTGEDSSYVDDLNGSAYDFYIDQLARKIYNPDSLPVGTDAAHVVCNVTSKNSGIVVIVYKDQAGEDSLAYYSSSDSIDFTEPREFRVYSNDGVSYRSYEVSVNVHKEAPDSINWHYAGAYAPFASMAGMKAVALGGSLYVFGTDLAATTVYTASMDAPSAWTKLETTFSADAYSSVIAHGDYIYIISDGQLMRTANGADWTTCDVAGTTVAERLIAAGRAKIYGVDTEGHIVSMESTAEGWTRDNVTGDATMLPTENIGYGCLVLNTDDKAERIIIAGNRNVSAYPEDSVAMVWSKIEEYRPSSQSHSWMFCNEDNGYGLPRLSNVVMLAYGDALVALGGSGEGTSTAKAFSKFYASEDNGLTWHADGSYYLPENFTNGGSNVFAMTTGGDNYLWIICGGTGDVWRGRLNRLGWEDRQTSFIE